MFNLREISKTEGKARFWAYDADVPNVEALRVPEVGPYWIEDGKILVPARPALVDSDWTPNLIVTNGKTAILDLTFGVGSISTAYNNANANIGVGTDSTAAAVGQTQLNPSVSGSVQLNAMDATFPSISSLTVTLQSTFPANSTAQAANFQWNETGAFNGGTNGTSNMLDRIVIGPFTKTSAVKIVLQIAVSQS